MRSHPDLVPLASPLVELRILAFIFAFMLASVGQVARRATQGGLIAPTMDIIVANTRNSINRLMLI